jgi:predicted YcjX-like family ATPase
MGTILQRRTTMLNRNDFSEKRGYQRMELECPMTFSVKGDKSKTVHQGIARNLSASGLSVICSVELKEGSKLDVTVAPEQAIVPPLLATCKVTRVETLQPGKFVLGVEITKIHPNEADQV